MEWTNAICTAIEYMEEHITEDITVEDIAKEVYISPFYLFGIYNCIMQYLFPIVN